MSVPSYDEVIIEQMVEKLISSGQMLSSEHETVRLLILFSFDPIDAIALHRVVLDRIAAKKPELCPADWGKEAPAREGKRTWRWPFRKSPPDPVD